MIRVGLVGASLGSVPEVIHDPHSAQIQFVRARPLSAVRATGLSLTCRISNPPEPTAAAIENALLVIRWHCMQWHVQVREGFCVTL